MTRPRTLVVAALQCLFAPVLLAQANTQVMVAEKSMPLAAAFQENSYFYLSRIEIPAGSGNKIDQQEHDTVLITLGDGLTLSTRTLPVSMQLEDGEVRYLSRGSGVAVANAGSAAATLIAVELKQHWDPEIRLCSDVSKCTRPIRLGETVIGETISLFTNGFVTAYKHRLERGGTLSSSYFSSRGIDHLLFIALSDLVLSFQGTEVTLKRGQSYACEAASVDVDTLGSEASWVVIRVETPKKQAAGGAAVSW